MKLLLDTANLLWVCADPAKLSAGAKAAYLDSPNEVFVSVASLWEIIVKSRLGKLPLPLPVEQMIQPLKSLGAVRVLPLAEGAVFRLASLPDVHSDPFDRMLVCQAIDAGLTIVTPDAVVRAYPVATLW